MTTSKGTFRVGHEEESRLLDIAQRRGKIAEAVLEEMIARTRPPRHHAGSLATVSDSTILAVRCKTGPCGAQIPLLSEVRHIFPRRYSITSLLCPIGHRHQYTETDVIEIGGTIQTFGPDVPR
jgi:hypothetical protein